MTNRKTSLWDILKTQLSNKHSPTTKEIKQINVDFYKFSFNKEIKGPKSIILYQFLTVQFTWHTTNRTFRTMKTFLRCQLKSAFLCKEIPWSDFFEFQLFQKWNQLDFNWPDVVVWFWSNFIFVRSLATCCLEVPYSVVLNGLSSWRLSICRLIRFLFLLIIHWYSPIRETQDLRMNMTFTVSIASARGDSRIFRISWAADPCWPGSHLAGTL